MLEIRGDSHFSKVRKSEDYSNPSEVRKSEEIRTPQRFENPRRFEALEGSKSQRSESQTTISSEAQVSYRQREHYLAVTRTNSLLNLGRDYSAFDSNEIRVSKFAGEV